MIVEGDTEEAFVKQVLTPYLSEKEIYPVARKVTTSRKKRIRGGMTSYGRARKDVENWLKQDVKAYCTTMFDLYALPTDFPGYRELQNLHGGYDRVLHLEASFAEDLGSGRFIPFILLHEYEALLLSDPVKLDSTLSLLSSPSRLSALNKLLAESKGPEGVDDNPATAPSKRLIQLYPGYDKVVFGVLVAERIGIDVIREKCPHFHEWISKLEALVPLT